MLPPVEERDRWSWNLSAVHGVAIRWFWVMRVKDMALMILALADYVYGTVILSSMQLVGPQPALKIVMGLAFPAIFAKLVSIFMLELGPKDHKERKRDALRIPLVLRKEGDYLYGGS
ncbi:hypothetical protein C8R44DRAFT_745793 [Mycena epipterygia]|nr:hypothetical protein C8R44DRAFT_745793 [Mycena epipterygia]